jgi:Ser/Thr protein kinase RdoA (MazF antagonist)
MERGRERAHPFVELSAGELDGFVGRALPGARVVAAFPLRSGLRNTNYRLDFAGGRSAVLRLYVADPEVCAREAAVLAAVAGRLPAPRVLHSDAAAQPPFALLGWLDGQPLDEVLVRADAATAVEIATGCGATLSRIHEIHFPAAGFFGSDLSVIRPMPAWATAVLEALTGRVEGRLGPALSDRVRATVDSNASAVESVWSGAVLVHADFRASNLLVREGADPSDVPRLRSGRDAAYRSTESAAGRWRLAGILDWEFACAGCKLIDFSAFLRNDGSRPPGFNDAFAAAYLAAGGALPADWRRLTGLVDLLNLLQLLAWADNLAATELRRLVTETVDGP